MLEIESLHKKFGDLEVLKGVSFHVKQGEVVALIGPSGSGKSTILRSINFLEPPDEGIIKIKGKRITSKNIIAARKKMGMIFQQFNLFPHMNVLENIIYAPMKVRKLSRSAATEKALYLLAQVGLEDKANCYPGKLSGGQKQRVAIARALAMDIELLLCDEPTSALDPEMVGEVLSVLQKLAKAGMTIIIVTHEMDFVRKVAGRVLFIDQGKIIEDKPKNAFFDDCHSKRVREFLAYHHA